MSNPWMAVVVLIVAVGVVMAMPPHCEAAESIDSLVWMCGSWGDPAESIESWMAPVDGLMLGVNRTVRAGKMPFFEFLRIEQRPEGIVFVASPLGLTGTDFHLKELAPERVGFENPQHDFPQRITYWLEGDSLVAEASAGEGEQRQVQSFRWSRRAACDSDR
jgi:hypothetical protein